MVVVHHRRKALGVFAAFLWVAITAVQFVMARFSLASTLMPADIATARFVGAAIVFLPVLRMVSFRNLTWLRACGLAILTGLPYPLIINWGLVFAPAAHAAALGPASIVVFTFLITWLQTREPVPNIRKLAIATIIVGLGFFIAKSGVSSPEVLIGDALFVTSGLMFSFYAIYVGRWQINPVGVTVAVVYLSCLFLPVLWLAETTSIGSAAFSQIALQMLIHGALAGAAAVVLYNFMIGSFGAQTASLFGPLIPISTTVLGAVVLGEVPSTVQIFGITIIFVGMILPVFSPRVPG